MTRAKCERGYNILCIVRMTKSFYAIRKEFRYGVYRVLGCSGDDLGDDHGDDPEDDLQAQKNGLNQSLN